MVKAITNNFFLIILTLVFVALQACSPNAEFEQKIDFKNSIWNEDSVTSFTFEIAEDGNYDLLYLIKNKTDYPFSNLFIKSLLSSEKSVLSDKLQEISLFDKKTGKPFGKGLGGVMESKFYSLKSIALKKGKHTITTKQYMRQKELNGIIAFGVRVEKVNL